MAGVAVVTGAGRGFGREVARRLAGRGYTVLCTDIDAESAAVTAEHVGGFSMPLDVRDPDGHREAARLAAERGPLEVWVNNAGLLRTVKAWEHSDEEVRLLVDVNLLGVMYGSRAAVEAMRDGPGQNKHLINIASLSALSPVPGLAVYAATKHAVLGFTTSLQGDLNVARLPITVHAVCPDAADTEMVRERRHDQRRRDGLLRASSAERRGGGRPYRRAARLQGARGRDSALAGLGGPHEHHGRATLPARDRDPAQAG